jgi:ABC-2 type transport system permease protein/oleandomycin transport system permease protein
VFVLLIVVGVGFLIGFRFHAGFVPFLGSLGLVLLFGVPICWVLALVGLQLRNAEGVGAAAFPLMGALVFISSAFVSTRRMPVPLRLYADHQPVTATVNAVRALTLGGATTGQVVTSLAWIGGLTLVFAALSVKQFNRSAA